MVLFFEMWAIYQVWGRFENQDFEKFEIGENYVSLLIKKYEN
jgi:hypothetical protein